MYRPFGSMWVEQEEAIRGGDHVWARADLMVGTRLSDVGEMGTASILSASSLLPHVKTSA
jgi:hypothetical protein